MSKKYNVIALMSWLVFVAGVIGLTVLVSAKSYSVIVLIIGIFVVATIVNYGTILVYKLLGFSLKENVLESNYYDTQL